MTSPDAQNRPRATRPRPRVVIASGSGRYADPWHPFSVTSARVSELLEGDGWAVEVIDDPDAALTRLDGVALLVVNAGDPWSDEGDEGGSTPVAHADADAAAGLPAALDRGIGVMALHSALASLRDYPRWRDAIGGSWERGRSWHPPIGEQHVEIRDGDHPITAGLESIDLFDELYAGLVVDADVQVLAGHTLEGTEHPLVWTRDGSARAFVSALGHDERAYDSPALRVLLTRAARWAGRVDL